jgi:hypothetical protein
LYVLQVITGSRSPVLLFLRITCWLMCITFFISHSLALAS